MAEKAKGGETVFMDNEVKGSSASGVNEGHNPASAPVHVGGGTNPRDMKK
jgi:hypothetical protein